MSGYDGRGGKFDIIAVRGADLAFTVTATDSLSAAIDLSAATITGELYTATGAVADTMTDVVSGAGSNIITLSFTDAETALLTEASYPWTLWVTRGGDKRPWLAGRVRVVDSSNGVRSTDGDAITLTVDSDVNVSISVLAIGGTGGGAEALDDLTDVTITTPISGNVLGYNGSVWVNTTPAGGGDMLAANNLSDLTNTTTARSNLGVAIGTNVQAYSAVLANTTASFTTADETKLDGIEAGADVTDTANVTAAGALMDSEVDADIKTLSLPASTTISAFGATLVDDANAATARSTLELGNAATLTVDADLATFALPASTTISAFGATLVDDADAATARTTIGAVGLTGNETVAGVKTFSSDPLIPDEAYGVGWNGSLEPPTKNAVYDKIETISGGSGAIRVEDEGVSTVAAATALNFAGAGVTVTDAGSNEALVTISGGGSSDPLDGNSIIVSRVFSR